MEHLINKDRIVAEIEKRITEGEEVSKEVPSSAILGLIQAYKNTLSFIDTLEVKEVDLDKEMQAFAKLYLEPLKVYDANVGISITMRQLYLCAEHFFELGLKAQKGE